MWNQIISPISVGMLGNFTLAQFIFLDLWCGLGTVASPTWHKRNHQSLSQLPFSRIFPTVPQKSLSSTLHLVSQYFTDLYTVLHDLNSSASPNPHPSPFLLHGATEQSHQVREIAACLSGFHLLGEATKNLDGYWMVRWDSYIFLWDSCCDLIWPY